MIPLTEREAQGLLVALRNAVQEAAQFQQAVAGLSAQITQPADVATLVRGVTADVRVPLLLGESVVVALGLHSHVSSQVWCAEFANNLTAQLTVRPLTPVFLSLAESTLPALCHKWPVIAVNSAST